MQKNRLEAFSDGVLAIIITIMVLELKVPHGDKLSDLYSLIPTLLSYVLSFIYIGIYWNNHHHLLHTVKHVNGKILWANMHLLFWLSLIPFATAWTAEFHFTEVPIALYGVALLMPGVAYSILTRVIINSHGGKDSLLAKAVGNDFKGNISVVMYTVAIPLACYLPIVSCFIYIAVAILWLVPDKRIENIAEHRHE